MDRILKYDLIPMVDNYIPSGEVLLIAEQEKQLTIWVKTDQDSVEETIYYVLPTGTQIEPDAFVHVGSTTTYEGFVWHVFRKVEE